MEARNGKENILEVYFAKYLVVAAGKYDEKIVPNISGLSGFRGPTILSSEYKNRLGFKGKEVLVVGSGNSRMEIALDLCEAGAQTSIIVRSLFHIVPKAVWDFRMTLKRFGNTAKYSIKRPEINCFFARKYTPFFPVIDSGTFDKIKSGEIRVLPALKSIEGNMVKFSDGQTQYFDAIIFATGYRSTITQWLHHNCDGLIGDNGTLENTNPNHWKGSNGLYCVGLTGEGLSGSSEDALLIAYDINKKYNI